MTKTNKIVDVSTDVAKLSTPKRKPPAAGMGRPKGAVNKNTKALKDMILGALSSAGGEEYLTKQANANPVAFMGLIGKVLPTELKGMGDGGAIVVQVVTGVPRD